MKKCVWVCVGGCCGNVIPCQWSQRCHSGQRYGGDFRSVTLSPLWDLRLFFSGLFVRSLLVLPPRPFHPINSFNSRPLLFSRSEWSWTCAPAGAAATLSTRAALHRNISVCFNPTSLQRVNLWPVLTRKRWEVSHNSTVDARQSSPDPFIGFFLSLHESFGSVWHEHNNPPHTGQFHSLFLC